MKKILILITSIFLSANAAGKLHAKSSRQVKFNQYIWNGIPSMQYHRVLAEVSIPENPKETVLIICPGGSYHHLDILNEGKPTQKWFNSQGASAIILRYRTANRNYHYPAQMQDIQRMIQLVRENPQKYGVSSHQVKIGLIGFSAGDESGQYQRQVNETFHKRQYIQLHQCKCTMIY